MLLENQLVIVSEDGILAGGGKITRNAPKVTDEEKS